MSWASSTFTCIWSINSQASTSAGVFSVSGNCHIPFSSFLCSFILITFRLCDASASIPCSLFHYPQLLSHHPPSSITCPPSILHHFVTPSPLFLSSILHLSHHLFHISVFQLLASPFLSILIFSTFVHYSLPPCSDFNYLSFHPL